MTTIAEHPVAEPRPLDCRAAPVGHGIDRFHALMAAVALADLGVSLCGYFFCRLTIDPAQLAPMLAPLAIIFALAGLYWWRDERKCFNIAMMAGWIIIITNGHYFPMYMAARTPVPMNDAMLVGMDRALGLEVPAVRAALAPYPALNDFMLFTYKTLIPLMTLATVLPPIMNRMDRAKEYAVGCIIAAVIAMPIFACLQAVGPWDYYGYEPVIPSLNEKAGMLAALKTDELFVIDLTNRDGLITFPSFHVVLTVLAAVALWPFRHVRWFSTAWAALIVVSTVTTGIHYPIDVLGGLGVAVVAYAGARAFFRWGGGTLESRKKRTAEER